MVKLDTKIVATIQEGKEYVIESVEKVEVKSGNKTYDALEVIMNPLDKNDDKSYSVTLWLTDTASSTSKLGSFISAFDSNDTDTWLAKVIKIVKWQNKDREIEVLS